MTDKQIIIDGVDVSWCRHFEDGECLNPCETVSICEAYSNCLYKQLKRKEQECERYKDKFNHIKKSLERIVKSHDVDFDNGLSREMKRIINECEVLDEN